MIHRASSKIPSSPLCSGWVTFSTRLGSPAPFLLKRAGSLLLSGARGRCHVLKYRWKGLILEYQAYGYGMAPGVALLPCEHWVIVIFGQYLFWPLVIKHNQIFGFMDVCKFIHILVHTPPTCMHRLLLFWFAIQEPGEKKQEGGRADFP